MTLNKILPEKMFLDDFGLSNQKKIDYMIRRNPNLYSTVKRDAGEAFDHYDVKCNVVDHIWKTFVGCEKLYVFTELEQLYNPFVSELDASKSHFKHYKLDVCVIVFFAKPRPPFIMDIEIDGKNHYKPLQMEKDELRDALLKSRYNLTTERVDVSDPVFDYFTACLHSKTGC